MGMSTLPPEFRGIEAVLASAAHQYATRVSREVLGTADLRIESSEENARTRKAVLASELAAAREESREFAVLLHTAVAKAEQDQTDRDLLQESLRDCREHNRILTEAVHELRATLAESQQLRKASDESACNAVAFAERTRLAYDAITATATNLRKTIREQGDELNTLQIVVRARTQECATLEREIESLSAALSDPNGPLLVVRRRAVRRR